MNLYQLDPYKKIEINELSKQFIEEYQLSLPYYYAYQLITIVHQTHPSLESQQYLDHLFIKKEENDDFRHGVIDAFCEIVKAGVKKIAFSHATSNLEFFATDLHHAYACTNKYHIHFYIEEQLIQTCLFKNSGSHVIIFYRDKKDIDDYLKLKQQINSNKTPTREEEIAYGKELGRLLSYDSKAINKMIEAYYARGV